MVNYVCRTCKGKGKITDRITDPNGKTRRGLRYCPTCKGKGTQP